MTRRSLVFHPAVEDDIAAIYDHYEQFDPALPGRFEARLDEQIDRIDVLAVMGVQRDPAWVETTVSERGDE